MAVLMMMVVVVAAALQGCLLLPKLLPKLLPDAAALVLLCLQLLLSCCLQPRLVDLHIYCVSRAACGWLSTMWCTIVQRSMVQGGTGQQNTAQQAARST